MDKTAIKNYAVAARRKLIEAVRQKAFQLYIFEDGALPPDEAYHRLRADGIFLTPEQDKARLRLVGELAALSHSLDNEKAYQHVMEEVAYTWFNRLIALRFMEVNDYLPSGIRILSSLDKDRAEPDAMREAERLDYADQAKIAGLRADTGNNAAEKLYKYILISQCNALSSILPGMFEKINDYTELLLPDALYTKGGVVHDLVTAIAEDDFRDQVQIIGWLYQYYISEKKDEIFAGLKKNIKINKETIPAATQLFTPEWIVKYMVENSLGRVLVGSRQWAVDSSETLKSKWKYYIEEAEQTDEVRQQLLTAHCSLSTDFHIFNVKVLDPCMGSGHILVYAFDVLYQAYEHLGYATREIPNLILENNIYGLDIDDRAGQLAYFALMMKARSYNRRFFRQENIPAANVYAIPETISAYLAGSGEFFGAKMPEDEKKACHDDLMYLVKLFENGKEYGSAMKIEREINYARLKAYIHDYSYGQMTFEESVVLEQVELLDRVVDVAFVLSQKYDVVVTNPPYMAPTSAQADFIKKYYPDSKADLCAVFIEKGLEMAIPYGYSSLVTMQSWMFLSSFKKMREKLLKHKNLCCLMHMDNMVMRIAFGTTVSVFQNDYISGYKGTYNHIKLTDIGENDGPVEFPINGNRFAQISTDNFEKVPGMPVAYWIHKTAIDVFERAKLLISVSNPKQGLITGDINRFVRIWHECMFDKLSLNKDKRNKKWFPYSNGGAYRKWYGNNFDVVNWENDGFEVHHFIDERGKQRSRPQNQRYYFLE